MDNIEQHKILNINQVFNEQFLNVKNLYLFLFNELPSMHFRNKLDGEKGFQAFKEKYKDRSLKHINIAGLTTQKRNFLL